jgi:hypothetical protein
MESTAASSFILHPNASVPSTDAAERFASMSVTRNPGATIVEERRARAVRVPASLNVDDIAGARPRSLAPRAGGGFFGTQDVEGAQPRALHRGISYTPEAVEGACARARARALGGSGAGPCQPACLHPTLHARSPRTLYFSNPNHTPTLPAAPRLCAPRHKVPHKPRH